jgi:ectoine hydroxylase-related dioxygenase (phytanoyl-CoA dioxygenase family)
MDVAANESHLERLHRDGYTVIEDLLDADGLRAARAGIAPFLGAHRGRNGFEGFTTERVYTLAARGTAFEDIATDPRILDLVGAFLKPGFLLTASQAINIHPGEARQGLHTDDSQYQVPAVHPRPPITMAMILAIDPFTAENGATVVVPGSQRWSEDQFDELRRARAAGRDCTLLEGLRPIEMPAGAALVLQGTVVHAGGANASAGPRLAITNQYCEPWARPQENFFLSVPRERVRGFSPRLQQLMGYGLWATFVGHVTSTHPLKSLEPGYIPPIVRQEQGLD